MPWCSGLGEIYPLHLFMLVVWAVYLLFFAWSSVRALSALWWWPWLLSALSYGLLAWIDPGTLGFTVDHGVLRCLAAFSLGVGMHAIHTRWGGRVLDLPWLRQLGLWSYAIYMLNGMVTAAASIVLAKPCYEWIEVRGRDAARNWLAASRADTRLNQT